MQFFLDTCVWEKFLFIFIAAELTLCCCVGWPIALQSAISMKLLSKVKSAGGAVWQNVCRRPLRDPGSICHFFLAYSLFLLVNISTWTSEAEAPSSKMKLNRKWDLPAMNHSMKKLHTKPWMRAKASFSVYWVIDSVSYSAVKKQMSSLFHAL